MQKLVKFNIVWAAIIGCMFYSMAVCANNQTFYHQMKIVHYRLHVLQHGSMRQ